MIFVLLEGWYLKPVSLKLKMLDVTIRLGNGPQLTLKA